MTLSDLRGRLADRRLFHAYIVTGGSDAQRESAGQLIAKSAVCSGEGPAPCGQCRSCRKASLGVHPDIETVRRDKSAKEHSVDSLRGVRSRAYVLPNEADRSVYIIEEADLMNVPAQNAMLKVFEEPPPYAVFVLLAENPERLLETVRSRCETVRLTPEPTEPEGPAADAARDIVDAYLMREQFALTQACLAVDKLPRADLPDFLTALRLCGLELASQRRLTPERLDTLTGAVDYAERMASVNVSAGHISGLLLARLITG